MSLILREAGSEHSFEVNKKEGFKFYSAKYKKIKFLDSLNFLKGSLSSLVSEHIKNNGSLKYTKHCLKSYSMKAQELLLKSGKQVFPYEYITSVSTLKETSLPPKDAFYNILNEQDISQEDYDHAHKVWDLCNCHSMKDYMRLYLCMDVTLLADVYLEWRETLIQEFKLDSLYFSTMPSYAIEAFFISLK